VAEDNYLHLEPGEPRRLALYGDTPGQPLRVSVSALNGTVPVSLIPIDHADTTNAE